MSTLCPIHDVELVGSQTKYGLRFGCTVVGCTVVLWDGSTSTPADEPTRVLRRQCHLEFDKLWKGPTGRMSRTAAYRWLAKTMQLPPDKAHIGMFDSAQCEQLLKALTNE
jgi:hypothetical protein